ncbi:MAG: UDP-glucose dehydrogenase family protein [Ilumatobacteraceae bacterium]
MSDAAEGNSDRPTLGVVGVGYVGLTTGACLAHLGFEVVCGDVDAERVEALRAGRIPIVEQGLEELVAEGLASGRLTFVLGAAEVARRASIVFLCVPTPQDEDGSADLSYIEAAAGEIGPLLESGSVIVNKSTVPVGSARVVEAVIQRSDISVVSNPEFLREGTAVRDFLHPDRVVVGSSDRGAAQRVAELYRSLDTEVLITDAASSETIKYAANGFLAMKLTFVNEVAALCEGVGADVEAVLTGIGMDRRIGREFLRPGPGWGGSCFPKDSRALVHISSDHGYDFSMMRLVLQMNEVQKERVVQKICRAAEAPELVGRRVAVLGLTFKAGTDDLRDSPSLDIARRIRARGADVVAYDPTVSSSDPDRSSDPRLEGIRLTSSALEAVAGAHVVAVLTEWPEFRDLDLSALASRMAGRGIVDARNMLEPSAAREAGLIYSGIGRVG